MYSQFRTLLNHQKLIEFGKIINDNEYVESAQGLSNLTIHDVQFVSEAIKLAEYTDTLKNLVAIFRESSHSKIIIVVNSYSQCENMIHILMRPEVCRMHIAIIEAGSISEVTRTQSPLHAWCITFGKSVKAQQKPQVKKPEPVTVKTSIKGVKIGDIEIEGIDFESNSEDALETFKQYVNQLIILDGVIKTRQDSYKCNKVSAPYGDKDVVEHKILKGPKLSERFREIDVENEINKQLEGCEINSLTYNVDNMTPAVMEILPHIKRMITSMPELVQTVVITNTGYTLVKCNDSYYSISVKENDTIKTEKVHEDFFKLVQSKSDGNALMCNFYN